MSKEFKDCLIPKPWGEEYLFFENADIGIWFLHINHNERTSLHCHPNKKTGLIVLNGDAEISFLSNKNVMHAKSKTMFWPGVWHSTLALSESGIDILEVEYPKDKLDLVRIKDVYGRENTKYESEQVWIKRESRHLWLENQVGQSVNYKNYNLSIKRISKHLLDVSDKSDIFVVLENHTVLTQHDVPICRVGDVIFCHMVEYLSNQFCLNENSIVLHIANETH